MDEQFNALYKIQHKNADKVYQELDADMYAKVRSHTMTLKVNLLTIYKFLQFTQVQLQKFRSMLQ